MLENIRIVMVNTSHPGNIGAAARAIKNMGLSQLYLVNPERFPDESGHARARASGADDVLDNAVIVDSLQKALAGCNEVYATSARKRSLRWPMFNPRQCAEKIYEHPDRQVAIVFGHEQSGLSNDELALCHYQIVIPTNEAFSSLNLASAIQVIVYELRMQNGLCNENTFVNKRNKLATADEVLGFYEHLQTTLTDLEFLDPKQPRQLMRRLQRLFNRAQMDKNELNIMRGILSRVDRVLR